MYCQSDTAETFITAMSGHNLIHVQHDSMVSGKQSHAWRYTSHIVGHMASCYFLALLGMINHFFFLFF